MKLRNETNKQLLIKVEKLFADLPELINGTKSSKKNFNKLILECHNLRRYRNSLLHAAFIELKSGEEVLNIVRTDVRISKNKLTGQYDFNAEILLEKNIKLEMQRIVRLALELNKVYIQLIHRVL